MRILHVNTFGTGGAANACIRLHNGLLHIGCDSNLLLKHSFRSLDKCFIFRSHDQLTSYDRLIKKIWFRLSRQRRQTIFKNNLPKTIEYFSFPQSNCDITKSPLYEQADIVHLHWVSGFLDFESFFRKNRKPVVWTLHDMEPFQGGTHYQEKYFSIDEYGKPKRFEVPGEIKEVIAENLAIKTRSLSDISNISIVTPSLWLKKASEQSGLFGKFPHFHIPYGLDANLFTPRNKKFSKDLFGLPSDKPCLLFVSDNVQTFRKGFQLLRRAFDELNSDDFVLCAVGSHSFDTVPYDNIIFIGRVEDERLMSLLFSAADAFIIPSLEDNLPNTVLESLLCGTPVIGFPTGGIPDMVQDGINGYLCPEISAESLRATVMRFLSNAGVFNTERIRQDAVLRFDRSVQANAYFALYNRILQPPDVNSALGSKIRRVKDQLGR